MPHILNNYGQKLLHGPYKRRCLPSETCQPESGTIASDEGWGNFWLNDNINGADKNRVPKNLQHFAHNWPNFSGAIVWEFLSKWVRVGKAAPCAYDMSPNRSISLLPTIMRVSMFIRTDQWASFKHPSQHEPSETFHEGWQAQYGFQTKSLWKTILS